MFTPTFNVLFNIVAGYIAEVILMESNSYGKPVRKHVIPVSYDEQGEVDTYALLDAVNTLMYSLFGKEETEWYAPRVNFVIVDSEGFAVVHEDFSSVVESWQYIEDNTNG